MQLMFCGHVQSLQCRADNCGRIHDWQCWLSFSHRYTSGSSIKNLSLSASQHQFRLSSYMHLVVKTTLVVLKRGSHTQHKQSMWVKLLFLLENYCFPLPASFLTSPAEKYLNALSDRCFQFCIQYGLYVITILEWKIEVNTSSEEVWKSY